MKKKILLLAAVLSFAFAANSFAAFAWIADGTAGSGGGTQQVPITGNIPAANFKPSANVIMGYAAHTTGASYTLGAYHFSGTFTYATTSVDTNIWRKENVGGNGTQSAVAVPPDAPADQNTPVDWVSGAWTASK